MRETKGHHLSIPLQRRAVFLAGAAALVGAFQLGPAAYRRHVTGLSFTPVKGVEGFRKLDGGSISGVIDPFVGLEARDPQEVAALDAEITRVRGDLRGALFEGAAQSDVQIASFSDFYCPYCRLLTERLFALGPKLGVPITWHEYPLFGPHSTIAAKGAIAARNQGAYDRFHLRMMRTPARATAAFVIALAESLDLDTDQFAADLDSDATRAALLKSEALAQVFRLPGTPALVVGRTVVIGAIDDGRLTDLVALERDA